MTQKHVLLSLFMTAVIVLTAWTTLSFRPPVASNTQTAQLPDAYMENVTARIMDKEGNIQMKIVSPRMVHYAENDTTDLTAPELTLYRKSPYPWFVTSNYAKATQGIDFVNFWENVKIHRTADENNPDTVIKTTTLLVQPNKQLAETSDPITLIQPNIVVKATGMYADMNAGDIKLLSQARGEYVPNS